MYGCFCETPIGILRILEEEGYVVQIQRCSIKAADIIYKETPVLQEAVRQLKEYFAGERREFTIPIRAKGTPFQEKAWETLCTIPYGHTISYGEEAAQMDCICARAVGGANGKNPIIIVIPCHRVIRANGDLGGYSGGLDIKEYLLALEQRVSHGK